MTLHQGETACRALTLLCPVMMAILAQKPGTRHLRVALYPVGVVCAVVSILSMGNDRAQDRFNGQYVTPNSFPALLAKFILVPNISLVGSYAFSNQVYRAHLVPQCPSWPRLRSWPIFKTIDIILSADRKVNYPPNTPLLFNPCTFSARKSLLRIAILGLVVDFFTLPIHLCRTQLYRSDGTRDFAHLCHELGGKGLGEALVRFGWMVCFAGVLLGGIQAGWELAKVIGVGSGIWVKEEWPELMHKPWKASSMTELWGKRYHQLLRSYFHTLLSPFNLPRPLYILLTFLISGLHHILIMYPVIGYLEIAYLHFFLGCGVVCLLEQGICRFTGRRIEGFTGRSWTLGWLFLLSRTVVEGSVNSGQAEGFRMKLEVWGWSLYPMDWVLTLLGGEGGSRWG